MIILNKKTWINLSLLGLSSCGLIEPKQKQTHEQALDNKLALSQKQSNGFQQRWERFATALGLPLDNPILAAQNLKVGKDSSLMTSSTFLTDSSDNNKQCLLEHMRKIKENWNDHAFDKEQLSLESATPVQDEDTHILYQVSYKKDQDRDDLYVGFVSVPKAADDNTSILAYAHSGESGLAAAELTRLSLSQSHIIVAPAFPGESLHLNSKQTAKGFEPQDASAILGTSAGEKSIWDQDADDLLALTYLVRKNAPEFKLKQVPTRNIRLMGSSRGGLTTLLAQLKLTFVPNYSETNLNLQRAIKKIVILSSPLSPTTGSFRLALYESVKAPLHNSMVFGHIPLVHTLDQYAKPYRNNPSEENLNMLAQDVIARDYALLLRGMFYFNESQSDRVTLQTLLKKTHFIYHENDQTVKYPEHKLLVEKLRLAIREGYIVFVHENHFSHKTLEQVREMYASPQGLQELELNIPTLHTLKPTTTEKYGYHLDPAYFNKSQVAGGEHGGKETLTLITDLLENN